MARAAHFGENMRNVHVKSRSFVIVGIFVLGFTAFSFWGLSTQNNDLLLKIELLEDTLKIGTHKQKELEDELQSIMKKAAECLKSNVKLSADLLQKENVVDAQAGEASQWRDKVSRAESEIEKLKGVVSDKVDELLKLKTQLESKKDEVSAKDAQIHSAQEDLNKMKLELKVRNAISNQVVPLNSVSNQTASSSTSNPKESNIVLVKPVQESEAANNLAESFNNEVVGNKPEEEVELVDPEKNVIDLPNKKDETFETKFNQMQEALGHNNNEQYKDTNDGNMLEPDLINSMGDDEETDIQNKNPRFNLRSMTKGVVRPDLPED